MAVNARRQDQTNPLAEKSGAVFVGRQHELATLRAGLVEAIYGRGSFFLLVGEPGIGKTRTAEELAKHAHLENAQVLVGRCHEGEGAPAYWPWIQVIRTYLHGCDPKLLMSDMGFGVADIAQVVPEVREHLPELPTPPALPPEQARFRLFDSITAFLKNAANREPLVLILDDLHWADKPSLLLLQFLATEMESARLLIVATYRDLEFGRDHPLFQALGDLMRAQVTRRVELRGLTEQDVARYIETTIGVSPSQELVTAVYCETEGNPFFMGEVMRLLIAEGRLQGFDGHASRWFSVPKGVREVIGRRLNGLSADCNRVLAIASVIGREFGLNVLQRVTDFPRDRLLKVLEEAVTSRVLTEGPRGVGRYSFAHALIRETLYEGLAMTRRIELHGQIGDILEQMYGANLEPHAAELAYHFFEAAKGGAGVDKAIHYASRAAARAEGQLAHEEAALHYRRALHALDLAEPADEQQRGELLLALGEAQRRTGDMAYARQTFGEAADLARNLQAPELLARAALGMGLGIESIVPGVVDESLVSLLEEALRTLGASDSPLRAALLARLAAALHYLGSQERSTSLSLQALQTARRVGDRAILAYVLNWTHFALRWAENLDDRLTIATEAIRLAQAIDDKELAFKGHYWRVTDLFELGDIFKLDTEIEACARLAGLLRQPLYSAHAVWFRAARMLLTGRFEESERLAMEGLSLAARAQIPWKGQTIAIQLFCIRREQGRFAEIETAVSDLAEHNPNIPAARCGLAFVHYELGRRAEAQAEFEQLAARDFADLRHDTIWLTTMALLSEVCALVGDARRAALLYERLLPYGNRNLVIGYALGCTGAVARNLGLLAATMARWEEATQHFETALAINARMGAKPFVARTQYEYARMLITRGDAGDQVKASGLLAAALATAQTLGMNGLTEKVVTLQSGSAAADAFREVDKRAASVAARVAVFRKEGDYWTIGDPGSPFRLRDSLGLRCLALLLGDHDREFLATDLMAAVRSTRSGGGRTALRDEPQVGVGPRLSRAGDADDTLDRQAVRAYRSRLESLHEQLTEATTNNELERATKTQEEIDTLVDELTKRAGLGGRGRKAAPHLERARVNVTRTLKAAIRKIAQNDERLGRYLSTTISTGTFCSNTPEPHMPVSWKL